MIRVHDAVSESDQRSPESALHFVAELGRVAASATELQPVLDWTVGRVTAMLDAEEGCLRLLRDVLEQPDAGAAITPVAVMKMHTAFRKVGPDIVSSSWEKPVAHLVTLHFMVGNELIATPDLLGDPKFPGLRGVESHVRALLAAPLKVEGRVIGLLAVTHSRPGRPWKPAEVDLLRAVAHEAAAVIARISSRIEAQRIHQVERDLEVARRTQMAMVPTLPLRAGPWEVWGCVAPALMLGGDGFEYGFCRDHLTLAVSDVSGKGLPAALIMASLHGSMRGFCSQDAPISEKVRLLHEHVALSAEPGRFVTLFYGELEIAAGVLHYTNAGHNYPLLRRGDGRLETLEVGGLPLGLMGDRVYEEGMAQITVGDALLLYSDGVTEATNKRHEQFGEERLRGLWRDIGSAPSRECVERITREIAGFRGQEPQEDDITLVVLGAPED